MDSHTVQYSALSFFVIYANDLADNLTIGHLLYADDIEFIDLASWSYFQDLPTVV